MKKVNSPNGMKLRDVVLEIFAMCLFVSSLLLLPVSAQTSVESDFLVILNSEREALGKNPIAFNFCLETAAYLHSQDMAEQNYFSHTSLDGRTFDQRIVAAGYTDFVSLAENIAYSSGEPDAAQVYEMWKNSAGHYANLMGDYNEAGLGVYSKNGRTYYTLDLGKIHYVSPTQSPIPTPVRSPTIAETPTPVPTATSVSAPTHSMSEPTHTDPRVLPQEIFATIALGIAVVSTIALFVFKKKLLEAKKRDNHTLFKRLPHIQKSQVKENLSGVHIAVLDLY
jgi:uncharacterized protein YkwD